MQSIVITGGLGYIGSELCKLYSGISWNYKISVIDNKFYSSRVSELRNWNINFYQGDILDKNFLKKLKIIEEADIVHHLAGITDVAYVKSDKNSERDKLIYDVAIKGTQNVLELMKKNSKIIFPSTHVVFDGLKILKKNLSEDAEPKPQLRYSKSKLLNEKQIIQSKINYVILRLGSVYGYSGDATRPSILPNLFSKNSSQLKDMKLFSGGKQYKSLVNIIDVARCFKFMASNNKIKNDIYNLSNENKTVLEIAKICKKYSPEINLTVTKDEVPNLGYTLDNTKLKKTGFKFLHNLETSIEQMIAEWSKKEKIKDLESIFNGKDQYIDQRGKISNYELTEPINLLGYITSKKNTVRANHYHPVQEQKCLLIDGQFISVYQDLLNKNSNKITHLVNAEDLIVTKPNVAHAMIFTKNSKFLNLVRGEREHKNYGITHTIKKVLVPQNQAKELVKIYKSDCRVCSNKRLKRIASLGFQPLANNLLKKTDKKFNTYPLEVNYCDNCHNSQLSVSVDQKKLFSKYLYLSSTSDQFKNHFRKSASEYIKKFKLRKNYSKILDIGSNDGIALLPFKEKKFKYLLGVEPAKNLASLTNKIGIKTLNNFFDKKILKKISSKYDLILASNVFAHADNLEEMANTMKKILTNKGTIIIEVQYFLKTLKDVTFDNIYHEHYNYWTLTAMNFFMKKLDLKIYDAEEINTHGGSLRLYIAKDNSKKINSNVYKLINKEVSFGITKFSTYQRFGEKLNIIRKNVKSNLEKLAQKYDLIGYGSPAKATTALNFYNIDNSLIKFILEDNILKNKKIIPGCNIPIKLKTDNLSFIKPTKIIVLAWNFYEYIKKKNAHIDQNIFVNIKELENSNFFKK